MSESESEEALQLSAVKYLRRHSMHEELWEYTLLGQAHPEIRTQLAPGERAIASGYIDSASWYLFTTRRVVSSLSGHVASIPSEGIYGADFANFKSGVQGRGPGAKRTEVATLVDVGTGQELKLQYETRYASMAPIYACKFWERRRSMVLKKQGNADDA